jgi:hypothetical protein
MAPRSYREPSPRWKYIESMLAKLKELAWEPIDPNTKALYGFLGFTKARNYCVKVLKQYTMAELMQITEIDLRELFMQALYNQRLDVREYSPNKKRKKG